MRRYLHTSCLTVCLGVCLGLGLLTGATAGAADAVTGEALAETCRGCHGIEGYNNVYPTYKVPRLVGQNAEYIVIALKAYRSGERAHATMHSQAATMSDEDMAAIAAYFVSLAGDKE